jgi:hypothetical protein
MAALALLALGTVAASGRCRLVRTATTTPGCYGYVGYADGVRIGWFRRFGAYVRAGSAANCLQGGYSSAQIGPDAVRLADGVRIRLDAHCDNGQEF